MIIYHWNFTCNKVVLHQSCHVLLKKSSRSLSWLSVNTKKRRKRNFHQFHRVQVGFKKTHLSLLCAAHSYFPRVHMTHACVNALISLFHARTFDSIDMPSDSNLMRVKKMKEKYHFNDAQSLLITIRDII